MDSIGVLWFLRLFHIGAGVFWVGSILFMARFIFPTAVALGPAAGPFMDQLTRVRKLPSALMGAAVVNILTGIGLIWRDSVASQGVWMRSPTGRVFGLGGLLAIAGFLVGILVNLPTTKKLAALGAAVQSKGGPPSPDEAALMQRLQRRLGAGLRTISALLFLATAAMALARYVT